MAKKNPDKLLFYFAIIFLIVSAIIFSFSISKVFVITGHAISGSINLTISPVSSLNFTTRMINWSYGAISPGLPSAVLDTSNGTVTNGNWTAVAQGLVLENIGNSNVSLDLSVGKSVTALLGGTDPKYMWNVSEGTEIGSCKNSTAYAWNVHNDTNTSMRICSVFGFLDARDVVTIDIQLVIPSDSISGEISDSIIATATA